MKTAEQIPPELAGLPATPMTGNEKFQSGKAALEFCVKDFWRWSVSNLVSNATRGRLAEFIVANALRIPTDDVVRDEWGAFDLTSPSGRKVEVKSAAFLQSWPQRKLSSIQFLTRKTRALDPTTGEWSTETKRQADVYVFALLNHKDKRTVNPLDMAQWEFYVLPTRFLDDRRRSQHSISLKTLQEVTPKCGPVDYSHLLDLVEAS
jgi:hypothetical protein